MIVYFHRILLWLPLLSPPLVLLQHFTRFPDNPLGPFHIVFTIRMRVIRGFIRGQRSVRIVKQFVCIDIEDRFLVGKF